MNAESPKCECQHELDQLKFIASILMKECERVQFPWLREWIIYMEMALALLGKYLSKISENCSKLNSGFVLFLKKELNSNY